MNKNFLINAFLALGIIVVASSCDDDFMTTGSDLINSLELPPLYESDQIITYSQRINSVQTNILNQHTLADYTDPVFGDFKSSVLTQVLLETSNNDFGIEPQLDSVVLTLPFSSREVETDEFRLDSVYGSGEFKVKVFKSNHLLRNINPGENGDFTENQLYFSDDISTFLPNIETTPIAESGALNLSDFTSRIELVQRSSDDVIDTLSLTPRIRVQLPVSFFEEQIFSKIGQPELASNANFSNYFRGLHIVIEKLSDDGVSMAFDLNQEDANITLYYQAQRPVPSLEVDEEELQTEWNRFRLNFRGIKVNLYEDNYTVDASSPDTVEGEENLYLKGSAGYYSVVELFAGPDSDGDGISDELQDLRDRNLLINEANLEFFVNEELASTSANLVNRIFLYNLETNEVIIDYFRDQTAAENPNSSRISHLGPLTNTEDDGRKYRIRITDYVNQLVNQDSTNAKLGLLVTDNVNSAVRLQAEGNNADIEEIYRSSVQFTKGTVLHGNKSPNLEKRVKLKIQATEIN